MIATEIIDGGLTGMREWAVRGATDALRGDPILKGGITTVIKIAHLAEAFGLPFEVHDGYTSTGNAASLHIAMAVPNCTWYEVLTLQPTGDYSLSFLNYGLAEPLALEQGMARAPEKPGLGVDLDWELINSSVHDFV